MKWDKKGLLCSRETLNLDWCRLNVMCPVPYRKDQDTLRIFVAFCDALNRGRIGYIDVNPKNPSEIRKISKHPILDIGEPGTFDDNGVLPTTILVEEENIYLYYCGFQRQVNVPYTSLLGLAVSRDGGDSFARIRKTPVLERTENELFIRTGAHIEQTMGGYELYYASGTDWFDLNGKQEPIYNLKRIYSNRKDFFEGAGKIVLDLKENEYGITIPQLVHLNDNEGLIYSVRTTTHGYRIGFSRKQKGVFVREEKGIGIDVSDSGWDSEMQCFGKLYTYENETYLFYCGNHYGMGGMGWAKLQKN